MSTTATAPVATPAIPTRPRVEVAPRTRARLRFVFYALFTLIWAGLFTYGFDYYTLGFSDRLHFPSHGILGPSGDLGLLYGYIGTALMTLLLLYSVRKRYSWLRRLGSIGRWLNVHIFFGIAGPAMILLHAGFKVTGAIAIGFWAMMGVMVSGFVGYYLLRQAGGALYDAHDALDSLTGELTALDRELVDRFGFTPRDLTALRFRSGIDRAEKMGALTSLLYMIGQDFVGMLDAVGFVRPHATIARLRPAERGYVHMLTRRHLMLERRRAFLRQTSALFYYWHAIHRPFTFVLFIMMGIHIGVTAWLGYALPQH